MTPYTHAQTPHICGGTCSDKACNGVCPFHVAARRDRIQLAAQRQQTRLGEMFDARATLRKCEIRTPWELLAAMNNIIASFPQYVGDSMLIEYRQRLTELATDLDGELLDPDPAQTERERFADRPEGTAAMQGRQS